MLTLNNIWWQTSKDLKDTNNICHLVMVERITLHQTTNQPTNQPSQESTKLQNSKDTKIMSSFGESLDWICHYQTSCQSSQESKREVKRQKNYGHNFNLHICKEYMYAQLEETGAGLVMGRVIIWQLIQSQV